MIWGILIVLIVVCLGFLAWLFCIAPASPRGDFAEMKKYDYAHRGLHEKDLSVPENSMAGFKAAVEAGYGIEFDLQLTKDKKVVGAPRPQLKARLRRGCFHRRPDV